MNEEIKKELESILAGPDEEEMWNTFFSEVRYSDEFQSDLERFLYASEAMGSLQEDKEELLANWYEEFNNVNKQIEEVNKQASVMLSNISKIDEALATGKLDGPESSVFKQMLVDKKSEIALEVEKLNNQIVELENRRSYIANKGIGPYGKNYRTNNTDIKDTQWKIDGWQNNLRADFKKEINRLIANVQARMIEKQNQINRYKQLLAEEEENCQKALNNFTMCQSVCTPNDPKYISAKESYEKALKSLSDMREGYNYYRNKILDANLINYLDFLRKMSFEDFYKRLEDKNFVLLSDQEISADEMRRANELANNSNNEDEQLPKEESVVEDLLDEEPIVVDGELLDDGPVSETDEVVEDSKEDDEVVASLDEPVVDLNDSANEDNIDIESSDTPDDDEEYVDLNEEDVVPQFNDKFKHVVKDIRTASRNLKDKVSEFFSGNSKTKSVLKFTGIVGAMAAAFMINPALLLGMGAVAVGAYEKNVAKKMH